MCGIICIFNKLNLDLIQNIKHRGQESYGIAFPHNNKFVLHNFIGKLPTKIPLDLSDYSTTKNPLKYIIGHTRYSTSGKKIIGTQTQPLLGTTTISNIPQQYILVHNGNISNRKGLKRLYNSDINENYSDTQILVSIINELEKNSWKEIFEEILNKIPGVYNLIIGTKTEVYIIRDRYGVRPLCIAKEKNSKVNYCILSESNTITDNNYEIVRDVNPGELAKLSDNGLETITLNTTLETKINHTKFMPCSFEYIYFSSKNSVFDDVNVTQFRYNCGKKLAEHDKYFYFGKETKNIIVVGAPETGITSGMGYADHLNLNYHQVLYKKSEGRTFILDENNREKECKIKYGILENVVKDKVVIILDDSLVRGNTMKVLVNQLKKAKVSSIHIRIASPPVISPCYYGIDIPTYKELIANKFNGKISGINSYLGSTSLKYMTTNEVLDILPNKNKNACVSCFTNDYNKELLEW